MKSKLQIEYCKLNIANLQSKIFNLQFLILVILLLSSCQQPGTDYKKAQSTRFAMGTVIEITVLDTSETEANAALEAGFAEINRISAQFYEGNPQGPIYAFNHRNSDYTAMPREILDLVVRSKTYSERLNGAFDISIGTILPLYKFRGDSLRPPELSVINPLLPYIDYRNLYVDLAGEKLGAKYRPTMIGLGAVAKGYGVDKAIEAIARYNVAGALVNAGGDLRALPRLDGHKWRVGIQDPRNGDNILKIVEIDSGAVVTSGDYEKFYMYEGRRIHHLLNPRTGQSADSCQSTTVIAPNAEQADAMATGLFVLGASDGMKVLANFPDCAALWICADGRVVQSAGFGQYLAKP